MKKTKSNKFMRTVNSLVDEYMGKLKGGKYEAYTRAGSAYFDTSKPWAGSHADIEIDKKRSLLDKNYVSLCFNGDEKYLGIQVHADDKSTMYQMKKMAKEWKTISKGTAVVTDNHGKVVYKTRK